MKHYMEEDVGYHYVGFQDGESLTVGPKLLQRTTKKIKLIQDQMRATQSRQKSYADKRRRSLEFEVGDHDSYD